MKLNILTSKVGDKAETAFNMSERNFWEFYLKLLKAKGLNITDKETTILAFILSKPQNRNYFKIPYSKVVKQNIPNVSPAELTRVKKELISKELINHNGIPTKGLYNFQEYVKKNPYISFVMPIQINIHEAR